MGLKIGYYFKFNGSKKELLCKVRDLRNRFKHVDVSRVMDVHEITQATFERGSDHMEYMLGFMMLLNHFEKTVPEKKQIELLDRIGGMNRLKDMPVRIRNRYAKLQVQVDGIWEGRKRRIAQSGNGIYFNVDVGNGCEYFAVMLARLGNGTVWRGMGCTKTQYAVPFVESHLTVVYMLDLCKESGILERVEDQGGYWESRDLKVLAENINASTEFMKIASKALQQIGEKKLFVVHNAIDECANYVNAKEGGRHRK